MDRLIYTALSGLNGRARQQLVTANNLANAQTPGFRRELVVAEGRYLAGAHWPARAQAGAPSLATPQRAGEISNTGRPMDVALAGNSWLAVQGPVVNGVAGEGYTRRGDLTVAPSGLLTTGDGRVLINAEGAPVAVPPGTTLDIGSDGSLSARAGDGTVQVLGRLKLVNGASLKGSDKAGDGLFVPPVPLPADPAARLASGMLEGANIKASEALAELVEEQRGFEVNTRLIGLAREMDEQSARLMQLTN
jgi:flagellar basal-body rod protein FlgF